MLGRGAPEWWQAGLISHTVYRIDHCNCTNKSHTKCVRTLGERIESLPNVGDSPFVFLDIGYTYKGTYYNVDAKPYTLHTYRRSGNYHVQKIRVKNFRFVKFLQFRSICKKFLTVDDYNMDERLESSYCSVYYEVSGESRITGCSRRSDIYPRECALARASLFTDCRHVSLIFVC